MISNLLPDHLDIWGFESGVMVYKDFSLGKILKLSPIDVSCSTDSELGGIKTSLMQALNSLPQGARVQFFQEVCPNAKPKVKEFLNLKLADTSRLIADLTQEKAEMILKEEEKGVLTESTLYLIVRLDYEKMPKKNNWFKSFFDSKSAELTETHLATEIDSFYRNFEKIKMAFNQAGLAGIELSVDEILKLTFRQWNPDLEIEMAPKELQDIRDQLIQTDQFVGLDSFSLGRFHHKVISLKSLPEATYISMIEVLRTLPLATGLYLSIEVLDQEKERSSLETQRRIAFATVIGKKGVADLDSEAKLKDLEGLLSELVQGNEKVFKFSLSIVVKSTSLDDLDAQVTEVLYRIRDLSGAEGFLETYASFDVYKEIALPNGAGSLRAKKINTSVLADFIPAFGPWAGHPKPRVLLKSSEGSLFSFDPFAAELSNSNQLVSGGAGSGKSFSCNLLILQMLKERPKIFILDIGGSYKKLCENLGGQYIELGLKSNHSLNPLDLTGLTGSDEEVFHQKIKFLVSLIEIMTKESEFSTIGRFEKAEIEKIVSEILRSNPSAKLSDIKNILVAHSDPTLSRLGKILNLWCGDSPYGRFTDRETSVLLEKDVICFDLKGMESHPDLQAATLFIITDLIWREVQKDRTQMKFCIMDECWRLLQSDSACFFIGDIFRTFRKYRASAVAISQSIEDFSKSKIASAILPNSSVKWILRQKGDPKELENALRLNPREMAHVNSLISIKGKYSEAFLMCEDRHQVVRIVASPLEYWIATTDPADLEVVMDLKSKHNELSELEILKLAASQYPQGASVTTSKPNNERDKGVEM